jgi:hypothetical protein
VPPPRIAFSSDGSTRDQTRGRISQKTQTGELYEISSIDYKPGSFDWHGDSSDDAERQLLQRQTMLQWQLLQEVAA